MTGDACTEAGIRELRRLGHCRIGLMTQVEERGGNLFRQTETFYRNWRLRMLEQFSAKEVDRMEIRIPVKAYELPHQAFYDYLYVNGKDLPFTALMLPLAVAWGVISAAADSGLAVPPEAFDPQHRRPAGGALLPPPALAGARLLPAARRACV